VARNAGVWYIPGMKRGAKPLVTYFLQRGEGGPIKIGITSNLAARVRSLSTGSAEPLRVLATLPGDHEEALHLKLASHRKCGEWFGPSPAVLREVARASKATEEEALAAAKPRRPRGRWIPERRPEPANSLAHAVMRGVLARAQRDPLA